MQLNEQLYNPPHRILSMEDLLNGDYERRHLLGTQGSKWDGEKLAIYHFTTTLHAKLFSSRLQTTVAARLNLWRDPRFKSITIPLSTAWTLI